jgi:purine-nucleoside/S-methyl-5'-thioadenosine phosphorylase / adenosine deaminase
VNNSFRLGHDAVYRCDAFQQFIWQNHGFGTREGNPAVDVTLRQVHSDTVVNARGMSDRAAEGDALVTDEVGLSIGVRTADCVPILMLDSKKRALAAVHAGWRGAAAEIAKHTVDKLRQSFGTDAGDLYVAMGPCIRQCCYEVGEEVAQRFSAQFPEWGEEDRAKRQLDLVEANRRQLHAMGVPPQQMFDSGLCTVCDGAQFFSYRREPENPGRQVSSIRRLA